MLKTCCTLTSLWLCSFICCKLWCTVFSDTLLSQLMFTHSPWTFVSFGCSWPWCCFTGCPSLRHFWWVLGLAIAICPLLKSLRFLHFSVFPSFNTKTLTVCMLSNLSQPFPAAFVMRQSMLFTSPANGLNVMAYPYIKKCSTLLNFIFHFIFFYKQC